MTTDFVAIIARSVKTGLAYSRRFASPSLGNRSVMYIGIGTILLILIIIVIVLLVRR
jgi:hypothetical protein